MIAYLNAIFLGIIEGLTEFIPVSSTAHLLILTEIMDFQGPPGHVFEIFIQLGAILAVVTTYRQKLWKTAIHIPHDKNARHFAALLVIGTIPALIAGAVAHDLIKDVLYGSHHVIATALIIGGVIMLALDRPKGAQNPILKAPLYDDVDSIPLKTALLIGCCQAIALIPGVSRSGASIMGGLATGLSRKTATEFSFFLAIPIMFAAVIFDTFKNWDDITQGAYIPLLLVGLGAAYVTALIFIKIVLRIVSQIGFYPFAYYRIAAGILLLIFL